jgi:hypothetical protein
VVKRQNLVKLTHYRWVHIVAKRKNGRYNPERRSSWIKIKNPAYTQIGGRQDLFQKEKARDNLGFGQESKIGLIAPTF